MYKKCEACGRITFNRICQECRDYINEIFDDDHHSDTVVFDQWMRDYELDEDNS